MGVVFAQTPEPPYVAVIFTNVRTTVDDEGYGQMAELMVEMAARQSGFLGIESTRNAATRLGITVSYWATEADAVAWKQVTEHLGAQRLGREQWYSGYVTRVAVVHRAYDFEAPGS